MDLPTEMLKRLYGDRYQEYLDALEQDNTAIEHFEQDHAKHDWAQKRRNQIQIRRPLTKFEKEVLKTLKAAGLKPYIYVAAKSGSCYFRFEDVRLRSLRIGTHNGRDKYRYKWNLRYDYDIPAVKNDHGVTRYYYPHKDLLCMATHMSNYYRKIKENN